MFCKWCGMESVTTDQCSWCHRPFATTVETSGEAATGSDAMVSEEPAPQAVQEPPVENQMESMTAETIKTPWSSAPPSESPVTMPSQKVPAPPAFIGVRRPVRSRTGVTPPATSGAKVHAPAPAIPLQRSTPVPSQVRAHPPAPPIPVTARSESAPVSRAVQKPAPATPIPRPAVPLSPPATPASGGRTALPVELLGGGQVTTPATGTSAPKDGLSEGVALPPVAPGATGPRVPEMGTFTPAKSKYYPGQVVDPVSGTHYDAETGQVTSAPAATTKEAADTARKEKDIEIVWDEPHPTMWHLVARYAGVFAILLALGVLVVTQNPGSFPIALLVTSFIAGMLLPVMRVVPWQDEDSDDVFLMLVLTVAFGPVVSLIFYSVLTALRQDGNPAIVGVLAVSMLTRVGLGLAAGNIQSWWHLMPFPAQGFTVGMMLVNWAGLIALAGWYFGNVFHKFDE